MSETDSHGNLDARTDALLAQMTLEEKVRILAGAGPFHLHAIERLGVPRLNMTDGPTGVRSIRGVPATVFPVGVAQAATWNPDTIGAVAAAIGREARALGDHVVLAPTINLMRIPTWGRNFETYSEDPYLAGVMGSAFVRALQAEGVGASLKHYAANNQELERFEVDAQVDERTLREMYLAAFERVVREADPWTVMASYNRLNGPRVAEHRWLLTDVLKDQWGYEGAVVSDWTAVKSTAPTANAGLDLEMPGPARFFGDRLLAAVEAGEVSLAQIDDNARRVLRLIVRSGLMDGAPEPGELRTPRHRAIAFETACEAMTLLKNDGGVLPFDRAKVRTVALIGPNARTCLFQGGGSSQVVSEGQRSVAEGLAALLGPDIRLVEALGVDNEPYPPPADTRLFSPDLERSAAGLKFEEFAAADLSGEAARTGVERHLMRWVLAALTSGRLAPYGSFRWSGWFWPETSGTYEFGVRATGQATFTLDGRPLITPQTEARKDRLDVMGNLTPRRLASVALEAGRGYPVIFDYVPESAEADYMVLGVRTPSEPMSVAIDAAKAADAVILVLGSSSVTEAEGYDREDIALPGAQDDLARAVLAANPNTAIVLNTGSPFAMPWIDEAPAVLQMWLSGETGPEALAAVLFGERAPGGRLPVTFPKAFGEHPAHRVEPDARVCAYSEGLLVGYRWFDETGAEPLFPFGHGLAYTTFEISGLDAPSQGRVGEGITLSVEVANTGHRPGQEVIQVYVAPKGAALPRPPKELKGFIKVTLQPGERRRVEITLEPNAFAYWDVAGGRWRVDPGAYDLCVGRSTGDIRMTAGVVLA